MVVDLIYKELLHISKQPDRKMILFLMKRCMGVFKASSNNSNFVVVDAGFILALSFR
jgi:hypothetical protein